MKKFNIGIIGPGAFGQFCLQSYQEMENVDIMAIAGNDEVQVREVGNKFGIRDYTINYQDLLKRKDIDAVGIFTPPYLHKEIAIACAEAKKPFLCEKPLALNISEANEIISAVEQADIPATIGYIMRYTSIYQKLIELVKENKLGKIKRFYFENYAGAEGLSPNHWLWDESKSGGILVEHGVHFFDIFSQIVGEEVQKASSYIPATNEAMAMVKYPSGAFGSFYHLFDRTQKTENNFSKLVFERGEIDTWGWIPLKMKVKWEDENGDIKIIEEAEKDDKQTCYRKLVQEVLSELLQRIENPSYIPKVTIQDGKESLATAVMAKNNSIF